MAKHLRLGWRAENLATDYLKQQGYYIREKNYRAESARTLDTTGKLPQKPIIFSKPPTTVTATNTNIIKNTKLTSQLDLPCEVFPQAVQIEHFEDAFS